MSSAHYQLRIKGLQEADGKISVRALTQLLTGITDCAERGLRLAIEGASVKSGRPPSWLEKAVNLTFAGVHSGSTILDIEAPTLGEVIGEELHQQDFWTKPPAITDTALTIFSRAVRDTTAEDVESEYYDSGVLRGLLVLKTFFKNEASSVELIAAERPDENVKVTMSEMEKAERLKVRTPDPQAFIVSGHLDAIKHTRKRFELVLPTGQSIPGRVDEEFITAEQLRDYWGKDVTIRGIVYFKPSRRIQLISAQLIKSQAAGDEVFSELPTVQSEAEFLNSTLQKTERKDWVKEIWNKWPGDESIEELLSELKRR